MHHAAVIMCYNDMAAALSGLVVSMLAMGSIVAGSSPAEDCGFLWLIKLCSMHFLWRGK
jgi:hypothetical protein